MPTIPPSPRIPQSPRIPSSTRIGIVALLLVTVAAMTATQSASLATDSATDDNRQAQFEAAAAEFDVPVSVLLGTSYLLSRWDSNAGLPSTTAGYGPMHLTDADHVLGLPRRDHHADGGEDPRGDDSRERLTPSPVDPQVPDGLAVQTVDEAAELIDASPEALRTDVATNIRGGAALLARYQSELGGPLGTDSDPAEWFGAVARYNGSDVAEAAEFFADEVFDTIMEGVTRTTDDGSAVTLTAQPDLQPDRTSLDALGLRKTGNQDEVECPKDISCEWMPAPYELRGDGTNIHSYGNHDLGDRVREKTIEYIVIHDTEVDYDTTVALATNKNYVSWHYSLRSADGHIAQHLKAKDVGWHAGNWFVNARSIGLEHEGFAAAQGAWYTEAMYRTSAKLVRHLATRLGIPLDRQHIIGHDNVQGILPSFVAGMHWDPGPYWDWAHYFELLKAPFKSTGTPRTGLVTINPDFDTNQPAFTGCEEPGEPCPPAGSSSVILHSEPDLDAPLVNDVGRCPDGPGTMHISDHCARASAGQQFVIADRQGDWVAIWYLGQKAWFHNPPDNPVADWSRGFTATPKEGLDTIPVYGRAYPEADAYPEGVPVQSIVPLQYTLSTGEEYVVGDTFNGEYYRAVTYDWSAPGDGTVIRGNNEYVQIQFGHRVAYVWKDDVVIRPSTR